MIELLVHSRHSIFRHTSFFGHIQKRKFVDSEEIDDEQISNQSVSLCVLSVQQQQFVQVVACKLGKKEINLVFYKVEFLLTYSRFHAALEGPA